MAFTKCCPTVFSEILWCSEVKQRKKDNLQWRSRSRNRTKPLAVQSQESQEQGAWIAGVYSWVQSQSGVGGTKCKGKGLEASPAEALRELWTKGDCPQGHGYVGCMVSLGLWLHQRGRDSTISDCSLLRQHSCGYGPHMPAQVSEQPDSQNLRWFGLCVCCNKDVLFQTTW